MQIVAVPSREQLMRYSYNKLFFKNFSFYYFTSRKNCEHTQRFYKINVEWIFVSERNKELKQLENFQNITHVCVM